MRLSITATICFIMASSTVTRTAEVLASHDVEASYAGTQERRCMHMTSLCPDRCNHANMWAIFNVDKYLSYSKPGQYGDEEQTTFALQLRPAETKVSHAPGTLDLVSTLAPGDRVRLTWVHEYVSELDERGHGGKYPIRRVTMISKL